MADSKTIRAWQTGAEEGYRNEMLQEIAAQLAELNEHFRAARTDSKGEAKEGE